MWPFKKKPERMPKAKDPKAGKTDLSVKGAKDVLEKNKRRKKQIMDQL